MGAGRGRAALMLCKEKRSSLGTGAGFPSQSKMPKYLLYLDSGNFQETERGLCDTQCLHPEMAPILPTEADPKVHCCISANPTCPPCLTSPSRRHRGTPKRPGPKAGSVSPGQPPLHMGKAGGGAVLQWEGAVVATEPQERGLLMLDGGGH